MTVSSDATSGTSAASGGRARPAGGEAMSGFVPALADCFTPRPQTGPGPLSALPEGRCLVLTGPARPRDAAIDLSGGTGKTQLAAHLARTWLAETPDGPLIWLDAGSRDALLSGYAQAVATARAGAWPMTIPADTVSADSAELTAGRFLAGLAEASRAVACRHGRPGRPGGRRRAVAERPGRPRAGDGRARRGGAGRREPGRLHRRAVQLARGPDLPHGQAERGSGPAARRG